MADQAICISLTYRMLPSLLQDAMQLNSVELLLFKRNLA